MKAANHLLAGNIGFICNYSIVGLTRGSLPSSAQPSSCTPKGPSMTLERPAVAENSKVAATGQA